jgi:hypothetical protein
MIRNSGHTNTLRVQQYGLSAVPLAPQAAMPMCGPDVATGFRSCRRRPGARRTARPQWPGPPAARPPDCSSWPPRSRGRLSGRPIGSPIPGSIRRPRPRRPSSRNSATTFPGRRCPLPTSASRGRSKRSRSRPACGRSRTRSGGRATGTTCWRARTASSPRPTGTRGRAAPAEPWRTTSLPSIGSSSWDRSSCTESSGGPRARWQAVRPDRRSAGAQELIEADWRRWPASGCRRVAWVRVSVTHGRSVPTSGRFCLGCPRNPHETITGLLG